MGNTRPFGIQPQPEFPTSSLSYSAPYTAPSLSHMGLLNICKVSTTSWFSMLLNVRIPFSSFLIHPSKPRVTPFPPHCFFYDSRQNGDFLSLLAQFCAPSAGIGFTTLYYNDCCVSLPALLDWEPLGGRAPWPMISDMPVPSPEPGKKEGTAISGSVDKWTNVWLFPLGSLRLFLSTQPSSPGSRIVIPCKHIYCWGPKR